MASDSLNPIIQIALILFLAAPTAIASDEFANPDWVVNQADFGGVYTMKTQMVMPNLEENLRYANATVMKCLRRYTPDDLFPILLHQSLIGCRLIADNQEKKQDHYALQCTGTNQTQGNAQILKTDSSLKGTINIRMGGKNMTFSQRVVAVKTNIVDGLCAASEG